jgi:hypothetical protein
MPALGDDDLIVEARAIAINPVDWAIQKMGTKLFEFLTYPMIFGFDVAGTVHSVGANVTRFRPGDRVCGLASDGTFMPGSTTYTMDRNSAFRSHVLVSSKIAWKVPETISFEQAAVMPMGMSVAASGLFQQQYLGCMPPSGVNIAKHRGWLLITAGASSIGACAIQLAVAAGYRVVSTCSTVNSERVRSLGASKVFDYRRPLQEQKDDLCSFLADKQLIGALAIGSINDQSGSVEELCGEVVSRTPKPDLIARKFVACVSRPPLSMPDGVEYAFVNGASVGQSAVGPEIFADFLPHALSQGMIVPQPPPIVVGHGLDAIQSGLDRQQSGVSFAKVVVTL